MKLVPHIITLRVVSQGLNTNQDVSAESYLSLYVDPAAKTEGAPYIAVAPFPAIVIDVICFVVDIMISCKSVAEPGATNVIVPEANEPAGFNMSQWLLPF